MVLSQLLGQSDLLNLFKYWLPNTVPALSFFIITSYIGLLNDITLNV